MTGIINTVILKNCWSNRWQIFIDLWGWPSWIYWPFVFFFSRLSAHMICPCFYWYNLFFFWFMSSLLFMLRNVSNFSLVFIIFLNGIVLCFYYTKCLLLTVFEELQRLSAYMFRGSGQMAYQINKPLLLWLENKI